MAIKINGEIVSNKIKKKLIKSKIIKSKYLNKNIYYLDENFDLIDGICIEDNGDILKLKGYNRNKKRNPKKTIKEYEVLNSKVRFGIQ